MILLTGGAGYIGSHIAKLLTDLHQDFVILDDFSRSKKEIIYRLSPSPTVIKGDIGDRNLIRTILDGSHHMMLGRHVKFVIHLAAFAYVGESIANPEKYYNNNLIKAITLIDTIARENSARNKLAGNSNRRPIKIIFSSSCATYGIPDYLPIDEEHTQNPISPYGRSKLFLEHYIKDLSKAHGLSGVILRYFNASGADPDGVIGEYHNPETHLIPLTFQAATRSSEPLSILGSDYETVDGTCIRDFVHVLDIAQAHILAIVRLEKDLHYRSSVGRIECFNLGTGAGHSVLDIISSVERVTGLAVPTIIKKRREGDPAILVASYEKAQTVLGWKPQFCDIDDIVRHAWLWYEHLSNLDLDIS